AAGHQGVILMEIDVLVGFINQVVGNAIILQMNRQGWLNSIHKNILSIDMQTWCETAIPSKPLDGFGLIRVIMTIAAAMGMGLRFYVASVLFRWQIFLFIGDHRLHTQLALFRG